MEKKEEILRSTLPFQFSEPRENKIKFTVKYEQDMINVCHVLAPG